MRKTRLCGFAHVQMGLLHTRETLVGTPLQKGISGGERKRVCVAQELLTKPLLLFMDEVSSSHTTQTHTHTHTLTNMESPQ